MLLGFTYGIHSVGSLPAAAEEKPCTALAYLPLSSKALLERKLCPLLYEVT